MHKNNNYYYYNKRSVVSSGIRSEAERRSARRICDYEPHKKRRQTLVGRWNGSFLVGSSS
jgi:hypothetical protein